MKAIIVAAGIGSRLGELTKKTTKSLVNVNDKTILEHQISIFKKLGINDITVIIGPYPEQYDFEDISFIHDKKFMEHDILSSFMLASPIIDDDVIVSYGDVIFDENILQPLIDFKDRIGLAIDFDWEQNYAKIDKELKLEATVSLVKNKRCIKIVDGRELQKSNNQTIDEIFNSKNETIGEFVGLMKLSKQGGKIFCDEYQKLSQTHSGKFHEANSLSEAYFTDMIQELIDSKIQITPISVKGKWCEIDTMQDLKSAEELF